MSLIGRESIIKRFYESAIYTSDMEILKMPDLRYGVAGMGCGHRIDLHIGILCWRGNQSFIDTNYQGKISASLLKQHLQFHDELALKGSGHFSPCLFFVCLFHFDDLFHILKAEGMLTWHKLQTLVKELMYTNITVTYQLKLSKSISDCCYHQNCMHYTVVVH